MVTNINTGDARGAWNRGLVIESSSAGRGAYRLPIAVFVEGYVVIGDF